MSLSIVNLFATRDYHDGNNNDIVVESSGSPSGVEISFNAGTSWTAMNHDGVGLWFGSQYWQAASSFNWNTTNATGFTGDIWVRETGQTAVVHKYKIKGYVYQGIPFDGITFIAKQNGSNVDVVVQAQAGTVGQQNDSATLNGALATAQAPVSSSVALWKFLNVSPASSVYTFSSGGQNISITYDSNLFASPPTGQTNAPVISTTSITMATLQISGTSVASANIRIYANGNEITSAATTANGSGAWTATIPAQAVGVTITSKAQAGSDTISIASNPVTVVGTSNAPVITTSTIYSNTTSVMGTAEADAAIVIFGGSTQIGTATADGSGNFTATITAQAAGVIITAKATASPKVQSVASASRTVQTFVQGTTPAPVITTTVIIGA